MRTCGVTYGSRWWRRCRFCRPGSGPSWCSGTVLEFTAAEVAAQLGTTVAAVNSALQRARAALADVGDAGEIAEPDDPQARDVVEQYLRAFEAADVPALVRLLANDAVLEMPPVPLWYRGGRDYGRFMVRVFEMRGTPGASGPSPPTASRRSPRTRPNPAAGTGCTPSRSSRSSAAGAAATSCSPTPPCRGLSTCRRGFLDEAR